MNDFYVYVYLDPRKIGVYNYDEFSFNAEPFYVGLGTKNRLNFHINAARKGKKIRSKNISKIKNILATNSDPVIIKVKDKLSSQEAITLEIKLIDLIGRSDFRAGPLMNMTDGGDGLLNPSQETCKKISDSLLKSEKHKIACACPKRNKKISDGLLGHPIYTDATRNNKISKSLMGKIGHKQTIESRNKISKNNAHYWLDKGNPITQYSLDGLFIKNWNSARQVEREINFRHDSITLCCKGRRKTAYKFKWKYQNA